MTKAITKAQFVLNLQTRVRLPWRWFRVSYALTLLVLFCIVSIPAFSSTPAQEPASTSAINDLLNVLLANGTITQQQYDTLKQHYAVQREAQTAPQPEQPVPVVKPAQVVTSMENVVGFHAGPYDVTFSGEINGFYVHNRPDNTPILDSSPSTIPNTSCLLCLASANALPSSSLRNGLLPGDLNIKVSSKQDGFDVAVVFGIWPGIESLMTSPAGLNLAAGQPTGFGVQGVDFRQQYLTFGKPRMGTFKVGRDLGYLGQEAILNDMALLGAGTTNISNGAGAGLGPGAVTLGRIGLGYLYTDFMPQIGWTSPSMSGMQVSGAIFQPLSDIVSTTLGATQYSAPLTGYGQPQYQFKATYATPKIGGAQAKLWTNYLTQSMEADKSDHNSDAALTIPVGQSVRANAADYGANIAFDGADLLAYGYNGSGVGSEGLLFLATSPSGAKRNSEGYYLQGTYTILKKGIVGMSYGQSNLSPASAGETPITLGSETSMTANGVTTVNIANQGMMRNNASYIGQARYGLTKWVNLVGEFTHTRSESQLGITNSNDSFALGSIAFF